MNIGIKHEVQAGAAEVQPKSEHQVMGADVTAGVAAAAAGDATAGIAAAAAGDATAGVAAAAAGDATAASGDATAEPQKRRVASLDDVFGM